MDHPEIDAADDEPERAVISRKARRILQASGCLGALLAGVGWLVWLPNRRLSDPDFLASAPAAEQVQAAERVLSFPLGNHHDACLVLGAVGDPQSIPALIRGLRWLPDDGSCTTVHCLEALQLLTGYEAGSREAWSTWWETTGRKLPASTLPLPEPQPPRPPVRGPSCPSGRGQAARQAEPGSACAFLDRGAGGEHTCVRRGDGTLWCWGRAIPHRLGLGRAAPPSQVMEAGSEVVQVVSSGDRTCVVDRGGDVRCWTWGTRAPAPATRATGMVDVAMGQRRLCARSGDGWLSCWTMHGEGELQLGTTLRAGARRRGLVRPADLSPKVEDLGATVSSVSVGDLHICAARSDGSLWCWGGNDAGQRGGGGKQDWVPSQVEALGTCVVEVSAGERHTCAGMVDESVWCWGRNDGGETGDGATSPRRYAPAQVAGLVGVKQIAAGARHTCARKHDGSIWCWGENGSGQLGDGSTSHRATPVPVIGLGAGVVELAAGARHTCARKDDGTIWCWGENGSGQLGDGTTVSRPEPVKALFCGG